MKKDKTWAMNQVNNLDVMMIKGKFTNFSTVPKDKVIRIISDMNEIGVLSQEWMDKKRLIERVENYIPLHDKSVGDVINSILEIIKQLPELEILSPEWIDENITQDDIKGNGYVAADALCEILVPKQEDMFNGETPDEGEVYFAIGLGGAIEINVARSIGEAIEILTEHETNYSVSGKPVIPQFVAHVIEAYKSNSSLTNLLADLAFHGELAEFVEHEDEDEVFEWVQSNRKAMDEILARAWLDGFTIADEDEEQKYYVVKSEGLDGVHYYFTKFNDEMNGLFTLPNDKKGAYRFDDKEKAQAIANYTDSRVAELED